MSTCGYSINSSSPRPSSDNGIVEVNIDEDQFEVGLDATHFNENDIQLKIDGNRLEIRLESQLQCDRFGCIIRREQRNFELPPYIDPTSITSKLIVNTLYIRGRTSEV